MEIEKEDKSSKKRTNIFQEKKERKRVASQSKKSKKSKEYKNKADDHFLKPKTNAELSIERKIDRMSRRKQIRKNTINYLFLKKRNY